MSPGEQVPDCPDHCHSHIDLLLPALRHRMLRADDDDPLPDVHHLLDLEPDALKLHRRRHTARRIRRGIAAIGLVAAVLREFLIDIA